MKYINNRTIGKWPDILANCSQNVFNYAVSCKLADVKAGIVRKGTIWDTLLFQKIQNKLGGKVKVSCKIIHVKN